VVYWQPLWAKRYAVWSLPASENERQRSVNDILLCTSGYLNGNIGHVLCTGCLYSENSAGYLRYPIMTVNVNGASTIFGLVSQVIKITIGST